MRGLSGGQGTYDSSGYRKLKGRSGMGKVSMGGQRDGEDRSVKRNISKESKELEWKTEGGKRRKEQQWEGRGIEGQSGEISSFPKWSMKFQIILSNIMPTRKEVSPAESHQEFEKTGVSSLKFPWEKWDAIEEKRETSQRVGKKSVLAQGVRE